ncbi:hypothetical protein L9F63_006274, partial [Diploptera punctata]
LRLIRHVLLTSHQKSKYLLSLTELHHYSCSLITECTNEETSRYNLTIVHCFLKQLSPLNNNRFKVHLFVWS